MVVAAALGLTGVGGTAAQGAPPPDVAPRLLTAAVDNDAFDAQYTTLGSRVVFAGFDARDAYGSQPWITDGTPTGTHRIAVTTAHVHSHLRNLTGTGSKVFFTLVDDVLPNDPIQLWVTDGSAAGTRLLRSLPQVYPYPTIDNLTAVGGRVFFNESVAGLSRHLWVSDGTVAGTRLVKAFADDHHDYAGAGQPMVGLGSRLYFPGYDATHGSELWSSDGTAGGTTLAVDVTPGAVGSDPVGLTAWHGRLVFSAGGQVYLSDGTAAGTSALTAGGQPVGASLGTLVPVGDKLFLYGSVGSSQQMVLTDGTAAGTTAQPLPATLQRTSGFAAAGGKLLFGARTISLDDDEELWSTDGTTTGTVRVKDIFPGLLPSSPGNLTTIGSRVLFTASLPSLGERLMVSDGTAAGTHALTYPAVGNDTTVNPSVHAGMVLFDGTDGPYVQPWVWEPGPTYLSWCALTVPASSAYAARPTATVSVGSSAAVNGKRVDLYDGTRKIASGTLAGGKVALRLPASLAVGKHSLRAAFAAQGAVRACSAARAATVTKVVPKVTATTAKSKVTVHVTAKNVTATGKVTVTVKKKGHVVKRLTATLRTSAKGKHVFTLPHLAKGTYTITTAYAGSTTVAKGSAKTLTVHRS